MESIKLLSALLSVLIFVPIVCSYSPCPGTPYPTLCDSTIANVPDPTTKPILYFVRKIIHETIHQVKLCSSKCNVVVAAHPCVELLYDTTDDLSSALSYLESRNGSSVALSYHQHFHLQSLLSGAMDNQETCIDWFDNDMYSNAMKSDFVKISHHLSNSLAMLKRIPIPAVNNKMKNGFPTWLASEDRNLLMGPFDKAQADLIVAKDGSGNYTTITEAVIAAPMRSEKRFVIYIKAGAYFENVEVERKKELLMFVGDGIGNTIVKAKRSVGDGWATFNSSTVAVSGSRFVAQGITFENSADPSKGQAVAFRSSSDQSAFYQCSFISYQDTLYVHSHLQFYHECDVYGTVDFIFGNAAAVLQNCNIYARKPLLGQAITITAQGRKDPYFNTGISIINCKIEAAVDLIPVISEFKSYLGRPWKEYSQTVIINSWIGDLIDPAGWSSWNDSSFALNTLYYAEYNNRGPGSNTSARVSWPGYEVIYDPEEARKFTVGSFIQGGEWLDFTGIPYFSDLN